MIQSLHDWQDYRHLKNLNNESVRDEGGSIVLTLKLKLLVTDWCFLTKMAEYSVMQ